MIQLIQQCLNDDFVIEPTLPVWERFPPYMLVLKSFFADTKLLIVYEYILMKSEIRISSFPPADFARDNATNRVPGFLVSGYSCN